MEVKHGHTDLLKSMLLCSLISPSLSLQREKGLPSPAICSLCLYSLVNVLMLHPAPPIILSFERKNTYSRKVGASMLTLNQKKD